MSDTDKNNVIDFSNKNIVTPGNNIINFPEKKNSYRERLEAEKNSNKTDETTEQTQAVDYTNPDHLAKFFVQSFMKNPSQAMLQDLLMEITRRCICNLLEDSIYSDDITSGDFTMESFVLNLEGVNTLIDYGRVYHKLMSQLLENVESTLKKNKGLIIKNSIHCYWIGGSLEIAYIRICPNIKTKKNG